MFGSTGEYSDITPDSDGAFNIHLKFDHLSKSISCRINSSCYWSSWIGL